MRLSSALCLAVVVLTFLVIAGQAQAECQTETRTYHNNFIWTYKCKIQGILGSPYCVYCASTMTGAFIGTLIGASFAFFLLASAFVLLRRLPHFSWLSWNMHHHAEGAYQPIVVTSYEAPVQYASH